MTTIVALSSGRPPAAVAVIRTSGPQAHAAAIALLGKAPPPRRAIVSTLRHPSTGEVVDRALVLRFDAPMSSTGEDIVEYQCHGGRAVVAAVLDALTSFPGMRLALPGEFTRRALANGRIDLAQAEGLADLIEAETEQQRRAALELSGGALSRQVERWQETVVLLSARAEAAIDYVDDDDETATDGVTLRQQAALLAAELEVWLSRPRSELLKEGVRVVIAGPPNSGKSSLINALTGYDRAIVSPLAGTTRDSIEVPLALSGLPLVLVDTAGLRETDDPIETMGVERALAEAGRAEILLWLGDPLAAPLHPQVVRIHSKADLGPAVHQVDLSVSALSGKNLPQLLSLIAAIARDLLPVADFPALNARHALLIEEAAQGLVNLPDDLVLIAETFRAVRTCFDRVTGRAGVEDALDALFSRFCLGK